ncbi:CHAT domain-containing tetratricopeptide repeat protein [Aurantiacibacter flavus]|uniref:CHAT domain-containing protein n=1 Tax=Aurantiacibacter flavus TaxID=3145232 RepID=A0ABV0CVA3_9SPHN
MRLCLPLAGLALLLAAHGAHAEPKETERAQLDALLDSAAEIDPHSDEPAFRAAIEEARAYAATLYPEGHPELALIDYELAVADLNVGHFAEGAAQIEALLPMLEAAGEDYLPSRLSIMNTLLAARVRMGDLAAARFIGEEVLAQRRKLIAREPENQVFIAGLAASLNNAAYILNMDGQPRSAIDYMGEVEALVDRLEDPSPELLSYLANTATYWAALGDSDRALSEGQRLTAKLEALLPPNHPVLANSYNSLSIRAAERGLLDDAERFSRRAIALAMGAAEPDMAMASSMRLSLAQTLIKKGEAQEALATVDEALVFIEEGYGPKGELTLYAQHVRAHALRDVGQLNEAIIVAEAADALRAETMEPASYRRIAGQETLAEFYAEAGRPHEAYATQLAAQEGRATGDATALWEDLTGQIMLGAYGIRAGLGGLEEVAAAHDQLIANRDAIAASGEPDAVQLAILDQSNDWALDAAMHAGDFEAAFRFAQYGLATKADRSVQMAAFRRGLGAADAQAVRSYQDKAEALRNLANQQLEAMSLGVAPEAMAQMRAQIASARSELAEAGRAIDTASFTGAEPITLAAIQASLGEGDAVLLAQPLATGLAVLVATKDAHSMHLTPLDSREVSSLVANMRGALAGGEALMRGVLAAPAREVPAQPAYDFAPGAALYAALFEGESGQLLQGADHIMVAAGGALTRIPFAALAPVAPSLTEADWVIRNHSLSTLASLSTLTRASSADGPHAARIVAVGAPVLGGTALTTLRSSRMLAPGATVADLPPLPEALAELNALSRALDTAETVLLTGEDARETRVLAEIAQPADVIAFATHGLLEGELAGLAEPALVLTRNEGDDGLLTASEIAALDMDADWVVLSACNTGGPDRPGAAGLSGLASAFLYAGARNLLVSHWEVADDVARAITVPTVESFYRKGVAPAEGLRRAVLALIDESGDARLQHPAYWAPFVYVGN